MQTILHISHGGLPDPRIERLAKLSQEYSKSYFFGSTERGKLLYEDAFVEVVQSKAFKTMANIGLPFYFQQLMKEFIDIVNRIRPDVVYAHNVIAGKLAHELGIPYIYDDHEYWSRQTMLRRMRVKSPIVRMKNAARYFWIPRVYRKWEREILNSAASVVTVSEAIAREHRRHARNCDVIPNFPFKKEIGELAKPQIHTGTPRSICLAADFGGFLEHRFPGNNREIWEKEGGIFIDWVGREPPSTWKWIKHREWIHPSKLLDVLTNEYQFGLIPWTDFWYHRYSFPNKAATYSHSGLIFVLNHDFYSINDFLPEGSFLTYKTEREFLEVIRSIKKMTPEEILAKRIDLQNWAKTTMLMDNYSSILKESISRCQ